jgi:ABC-type glycerol-3-phosphate transport system permease component
MFATGYVPGEVLEAARVDGASEMHIFLRIGLRMLGPGFVTVFLFQVTSIWNNFFLPLAMLSDEHLYPISPGRIRGTARPRSRRTTTRSWWSVRFSRWSRSWWRS